MPTDVVYVDGQALLPQTRAGTAITWDYVDGQAGALPADQPSGTIEDGAGAASGTGAATATGRATAGALAAAAGTGAATATSRNIPLTATPGAGLIALAWTALPNATGHKVERRVAP